MGALYHVAQTAPRVEAVVRENVKELGFTVFHPTAVEGRRVRHLGWSQCTVPLFPGYLFVRFDPRRDNWRPICSVRGMQRLLGPSPEDPFGIPDSIMDELIARHAAGEFQVNPIVNRGIMPGTKGRVLTGSFADMVGECIASSAKRVDLLLHLFGGTVRTSFLVQDVAAA